MESKYIDLLLSKCIDLNQSKILFICYDTEIENFVKKLIDKSKKIGVKEVCLDKVNIVKEHDILKNHTIKEIEEGNFFDKSIWDTYAKKHANFLIIDTEQPHIMDDIESEKIIMMTKQKRESRPVYRKMVSHCELPWCIAAYPSKLWGQEVFKDDKDSYDKLKDAIFSACMINKDNPISAWEKQLAKTERVINYLNNLSLTKLNYKNSLGTDLTVYLPTNYRFASAKDNNVIVNMPSYEVFLSPLYDKTEGIVYSSMPLCYGGAIIDKFWIKFEKGKATDCGAEVGANILEEIINTDENSCYIGECALVEHNSPISNLGLIFGTTLLDENASCHLALGSGFPECIEGGIKLSDEELLKKGINVSKTHVDFMIGTKDLNIIGTTSDGKELTIFKDGNFSEEMLK